MPMYDRICQACGHTQLDCWEPIQGVTDPRCPTCGEPLRRGFTQRPAAVLSDDIPGGVEIRHGLCHPDGTPRTYYSHSEIRRECQVRGVTPKVEHVTRPDTDKSPHTSRWVSAPLMGEAEAERVRRNRQWLLEQGFYDRPVPRDQGIGLVLTPHSPRRAAIAAAFERVSSSGHHQS